MFATILFPQTLEPAELDNFLANGWYRMGQSVFTTHFLSFNNNFYSAVWLRVCLTDAVDDAKFIQLQKQNRQFRTEIKKADITQQQEALYKNYKQAIAFEPTETLQTLLFGFATTNLFNTYCVNIYDHNTLIASGFFDLGEKSAAGIVSFYHPDYKKYSLGKYLIYLKMDFCKKEAFRYFYPGYFAPGYPPFDYKLSMGKSTLEYFALGSRNWVPYTTFSYNTDPLKHMDKMLTGLQEKLTIKKISSQLLYYRFFDANLDPYYSDDQLFDYPVFLYFLPVPEEPVFKLIIFDISNGHYCMLQCSSVVQINWLKTIEHIFTDHLLKVDGLLLAAKTDEEMIAALVADNLHMRHT